MDSNMDISAMDKGAVIKVFGVGGGGGNAVKHMMNTHIEGVEFYFVNTDVQALSDVQDRNVIQIGRDITRGLGAGAKPEVGRDAAVESVDEIREALNGADMVFITAGMGGGTGTGAAPIVAQVAKEMGILTVGVVTTPFAFEGKRRSKIANEGHAELRNYVDSLITVPNNRLISALGHKMSLMDAFAEANNVLFNAVQGVSDLIVRPGLINVDFADVHTVMHEMGIAMMGTGIARGQNRAEDAVMQAINSPLLDNIDLHNARGILINITGGADLGLGEFHEIGSIIDEYAHEDAAVITGAVIDMNMADDIRVTIVATGLDEQLDAQPTSGNGTSGGGPSTIPLKQQAHKAPLATTPIRRQVSAERYVTPYSTHREPVKASQDESGVQRNPNVDVEFLDIPAFLRRRAASS
jgi:cell division protein FtsZ